MERISWSNRLEFDCWRFRGRVFSIFLALAGGLAGCGDENGFTSQRTYPVRGKVLLPDGTPLSMGRIMFVSTSRGLTYGGVIGSDGTFTVKSTAREGAPEGEYKVRIEIDETSLPQSKAGKAQRGARFPFAKKYTDEDASQLTATVKPDESSNQFEFKLTK